MKYLNKKTIAAACALILGIIAVVTQFLQDPAVAPLLPVDVSGQMPVAADAGSADSGL